jgi:hypothetical protein
MHTSIPLKVLHIDEEGYHLMMKALINNRIAWLIVDTGASKTVLDSTRVRKYVKQETFTEHDKLSSGLGTNSMASQIADIKKIRLGELEIRDYKVVLLDLSHVNSSYEQVGLEPVEGVLGSDILLKYKAVIDYDKKVLKLRLPRVRK